MIMGEKAETYDGISVVMKDMEVTGDIAHEDYHRDFSLVLDSTKFNGAMNQYGVDQWIEAGEQEGFADYCPDKTFDIQHGLTVSLKGESTWIVTADSYLYGLELEPGSVVKGVIYVDGVMQNGKEGSYKGNVVVKPLSGRSQHEMTAHGFVPKTEASTTPATSSTPTPTPTPAEHTTHNWVASETVAATCTTEGYILYTCTGCSETYKDILPATEHAYMATVTVAPTCDTDGYTVYECTKCKDVITVPIPATSHNYIAVAYVAPTCETDGYTYYECSICKSGYADPVPATGHDWHEMGGSPPTCTFDETTNWECSICGLDYKEVHPGTALGHNYQWQYTASPTCVDYGYECYFCSRCGEEYHENFKPPYGTEGDIGHDYVLTGKYDTFFHYYACKLCGKEYAEPHKGDPCSVCGKSGA